MWRPWLIRLALGAGLFGVYMTGALIASQRAAAAMASAANRFLASLTPEQRQQAALPFASDDRTRWHYVPTESFPRRGLTIKVMNETQRQLAHALLKAGLSQHGYATATAIMNLETILRALEGNGRIVRDPEIYYFSIFGEPTPKGPWGWRVEGHHVSIHFTVLGGTSIASAPTFLGTNPAEVREGPKKGLRILGAEEDTARALLDSLDAAQRTTALITDIAPTDIVTTNQMKAEPLSPVGVKASALNPKQRELLMKVIEAYTSLMADDIASDRLARLRKAGLEQIAFAWAGPPTRGAKHYYRVQGPTFLIEYDNTQNDGNHVHSVWRDFDGDFGRDLLREHIKSVAH
jgi:Protein of unknown function (DUF3500)